MNYEYANFKNNRYFCRSNSSNERYFFIFSPSELWTIILIGAFIFVAYFIQPIQWAEEDRIFIFGYNIYESREVYQQYKLFGVIPILSKRILQKEKSLLSELPAFVPALAEDIIATIPFGTIVNGFIGNKALT